VKPEAGSLAVPGPALEWDAFCRLESMNNHWDRPGWSEGRRAYYWYLTVDDAQVIELAARCQAELDLPYLDLVPLDHLHLTVKRLGFEDEIAAKDVTIAQAAALSAAKSIPPFALEVGPLAGSAGAVRLSVDPWRPVNQLRSALGDALKNTSRTPRTPPAAEFRPHIGIAYCNAAVAARPLRNIIERLRPLPRVTVRIDHCQLVLLERRDHAYRWSLLDRIRLSASPERRPTDKAAADASRPCH